MYPQEALETTLRPLSVLPYKGEIAYHPPISRNTFSGSLVMDLDATFPRLHTLILYTGERKRKRYARR